MSDGKSLLDSIDNVLDEVDAVFGHVNKGLSILAKADDLAGELSNPDEPCVQGDDSDNDE